MTQCHTISNAHSEHSHSDNTGPWLCNQITQCQYLTQLNIYILLFINMEMVLYHYNHIKSSFNMWAVWCMHACYILSMSLKELAPISLIFIKLVEILVSKPNPYFPHNSWEIWKLQYVAFGRYLLVKIWLIMVSIIKLTYLRIGNYSKQYCFIHPNCFSEWLGFHKA